MNPATPQQSDPNGLDAHELGAKLDAGKIRPSLVIGGFARALVAVAEVATYGARKYTDGGWSSVPDGMARYTDAKDRHRLAGCVGWNDPESGLSHRAHEAWNALAVLELELRDQEAIRTTGKPTTIALPVREMSPQPNPEGWLPYLGGCPVRQGDEIEIIWAGQQRPRTLASHIDWTMPPGIGRISYYRVMAKAEAEIPVAQPDADGWIDWKGGDRPMNASEVVEVRFRDGIIGGKRLAASWVWRHTADDNDIVAYRIHKPAEPEKAAEPHAELRKTWAPGQRWESSYGPGDDWTEVCASPPNWYQDKLYRRHPDEAQEVQP